VTQTYDANFKVGDYCIHNYTHDRELMKLMGSHGSFSLLPFMMKVMMVANLMNNFHKVKTTIIVVFHSNCCYKYSFTIS
jgi:hypothetical protein